METRKFIGLSDRAILSAVQSIEEDFLKGRTTIDGVRIEISKFHEMATDPDVKKFLLMEYDGLEMAKRSVT